MDERGVPFTIALHPPSQRPSAYPSLEMYLTHLIVVVATSVPPMNYPKAITKSILILTSLCQQKFDINDEDT